MKKNAVIFFLFFCAYTSVVFADWLDNWIEAVKQCDAQEYTDGLINFTLSINQLESKGDITHPHVFVDRARLYSLLDRNEEALIDLNRAFESPLLQGEDFLRATDSCSLQLRRRDIHIV